MDWKKIGTNIKNILGVVAPIAATVIGGPEGTVAAAILTAIISHTKDFDHTKLDQLNTDPEFQRLLAQAEKVIQDLIPFFEKAPQAQDKQPNG